MKPEFEFEIGLPEYTVQQLTLEDLGEIQTIYEKCLDYVLLIDGHAADPAGIEEDFQFVPSGKSIDDKFVYGIIHRKAGMVGLLDTLRWYPDQTTWWIGEFLIMPDARSQGLGEKVIESFVEYARARGAQAIMLGVVAENVRAYKFWNRIGFAFVRETEPRQFGNKTQTVKVMRRVL